MGGPAVAWGVAAVRMPSLCGALPSAVQKIPCGSVILVATEVEKVVDRKVSCSCQQLPAVVTSCNCPANHTGAALL